MRNNKYEYEKIIQQNYGCVWEDVSSYEANSQGIAQDIKLLKHDLAEYRLLCYPTRVIFRKSLIK